MLYFQNDFNIIDILATIELFYRSNPVSRLHLSSILLNFSSFLLSSFPLIFSCLLLLPITKRSYTVHSYCPIRYSEVPLICLLSYSILLYSFPIKIIIKHRHRIEGCSFMLENEETLKLRNMNYKDLNIKI